MSNFMSNSDALQVLGTYANSIKAATPTEITYAQFQQLTPQQQESGNYIVSDWPGSDLQVVDEVADNNMKAVTSNAVYNTTRIVLGTVEIGPLTIAAGQVVTFNDTSDAIKGKRFNGIEILNVANFNVSITQAYIDNAGFHGVIKNNGSSEITTGRIIVHYSN